MVVFRCPKLRVLRCHGQGKQEQKLLTDMIDSLEGYDVVVSTYTTFTASSRYKGTLGECVRTILDSRVDDDSVFLQHKQSTMSSVLKRHSWRVVVVDEGHALRNTDVRVHTVHMSRLL